MTLPVPRRSRSTEILAAQKGGLRACLDRSNGDGGSTRGPHVRSIHTVSVVVRVRNLLLKADSIEAVNSDGDGSLELACLVPEIGSPALHLVDEAKGDGLITRQMCLYRGASRTYVNNPLNLAQHSRDRRANDGEASQEAGLANDGVEKILVDPHEHAEGLKDGVGRTASGDWWHGPHLGDGSGRRGHNVEESQNKFL